MEMKASAKRVTEHVHMVTVPFSVPTPAGAIPRSVNVFLVCGEGVTLIDAGVSGGEGALFSYLESIGRGRGEISRLVLTHSHPDHIGAAAAIRAATGCAVVAGGPERAWIEDTELQARERPVPGFSQLVGGAVPVDRVVADGETIDLGGLALEVVATPGHSAGSLSFRLPGEGVVFTGDAIPLPSDLPVYDDFRQSLASLDLLRAFDATLLLEAWREPLPPAARIDEGAAWLHRIDEAVRRVSPEAGSDPMDLCRRVIAELGLPPVAANPLVARSFLSHLKGDRSGTECAAGADRLCP